ncbi:MAG: TonB-dependent receptor domain-containing protein [Bacteroidales bacterium]
MKALKRGNLSAVGILVLVLLTRTPALAQTFRGSIQGTVTDTTGGALPGTTVTATNPATKLSRTVVADTQGNYFFAELPLGDYEVKATLSGFGTQTVTGIHVVVGASQRVNIQLSLGGVQERVEVAAVAPLVETTGNTLGGTIDAKEVAALPLNGRDFTKLLVLAPGSAGDPSGAMDSPGSFGLFSINGSRGRSNNYLLDGTDMNDGYRNLPAINEGGVFGTPSTVLPVDAVAELRILSGTQAEFGRSSGAIVTIVTKSGTNTRRGSVYEYFRSDALDSRNYFNPEPQTKDHFSNNQFGGSIGGPIVKNRTFWFVAYEGQREDVGLPSLSHVPDRAVLATATNPVIRNLVALDPWPAPNIAGAAPDEANLLATTRASNRVDSLILKVDQHLGNADLLTGRYFLGDSDQSFPLAVLGGNVLPGYNTVTPTRVQILSMSYIHTFSPRVLMELRGGYNHFAESFLPEDGSFNPASVGLNTGVSPQDYGLPLFRITGYAPIGANASVPRGRTDVNIHAVSAFSYTTGRHNTKWGYEFRRTTVDGYFDAGYRGVINFASLDDFLAGNPTSSGSRQAVGNSQRFTFQNSHGLYVQDNYTVKPTVTLNYGLRWDYMGVLGEKNNQLSVLDQKQGLVQVGTGGLDRLYPRDLSNFGPRLSAVWDLSGKGRSVVRASWGLFFDSYSQDYFVGQLPFNTFNPGPGYNGIGPSPILFSYSPTSTLAVGAPVFEQSTFAASDVFTVAQDLKTPYMHNFNVNFEQQIGPHAAVQAGYVGSLGRRLYRFRDINQADPKTGARPFDNGPFAPDGSSFYFVNQFESTAESRYNALQVSFNVRELHGLTWRADYTWSHSRDNASDGQDYVPNAAQPDNSFRPDLEWADSNFDVRHRFTMTFSYQLPASSKARALTSGWTIDGVLTLASGQPYNLNYLFEGDYNGSGEWFGRPDLVGDPFAGTNSSDRFLNLTAFAVPCTWDQNAGDCVPGSGHFGNVPRNAYRGPGYHNLDLAISRAVPFKRTTLQFRVDFFNIFNVTNYSNPLMPNFSTDFLMNGIDSATGRAKGYLALSATPDVAVGNPFLGGGGPRNIQLSVKLTF